MCPFMHHGGGAAEPHLTSLCRFDDCYFIRHLGSAGSFAIQLARLFGAEGTGVDNSGKLEFMRALCVNHAMDYAQQDSTKGGERYDRIPDVVGQRSVFDCQCALKPNGIRYDVGESVAVLLHALFLGSLVGGAYGGKIRMLGVPLASRRSGAAQ